jgi:hypothetical protein
MASITADSLTTVPRGIALCFETVSSLFTFHSSLQDPRNPLRRWVMKRYGFLAKTQNDIHEKCMNDPFFNEGYSSGMYGFTIKLDFYHFFFHLLALFSVKKNP